MSRHRVGPRRGAPLLLAAALWLVAPGPALEAQEGPDASEDRAALEARLEAELQTLLPVRARAEERMLWEAEVRNAARLAAATVPHDTLRVGALRVVVPPGGGGDARSAAEDVWRESGPRLGRSVGFLDDAIFVADPEGSLDRLPFRAEVYSLRGRTWPSRVYSRDQLGRDLRNAMGRHLARQTPAPFRDWADLAGMLVSTAPSELEGLYRQLVLNRSPAMAGCLAGDHGSCWAALGLHPTDDPVSLWYAEEDLERAASPANPRSYRALWSWNRCRMGEGAAHCEDFLTSAGWLMSIPGPASFRGDMLAFALEQGGEGAVERLFQGWPEPEGGRSPLWDYRVFSRDVRDRIVAASGMPEDAFIAAWRARIVAARPDLRAGGEQDRLGTLLWVLFFAAFATRSTRWRLG